MKPEILSRPMFQTPQMREGSGIMAGVAPIRGYAEGDVVEDYDPSITEIMRELPGMVVGDDDTMSDFFSMDKTPEGSGLNLRDITDFLIVDPSDPVDVAIAGTTGALMVGGITAPAGIAAHLARLGYKGKKVTDAINKAVKLAGRTPGRIYGTGMAARGLASIAPLAFGDEPEPPVPDEEIINNAITSIAASEDGAGSNAESDSEGGRGILSRIAGGVAGGLGNLLTKEGLNELSYNLTSDLGDPSYDAYKSALDAKSKPALQQQVEYLTGPDHGMSQEEALSLLKGGQSRKAALLNDARKYISQQSTQGLFFASEDDVKNEKKEPGLTPQGVLAIRTRLGQEFTEEEIDELIAKINEEYSRAMYPQKPDDTQADKTI